MKKITLLLALLVASISFGQDMTITGIFDGSLTGGTPKTIEVYVINDITDLSTYGIGSANNGGGTDGIELQFAGSATAGDYIYIASDQPQFNAFFGFDPDYVNSTANNNGDDAVELFNNVADDGMGGLTGTVIDTFGDINTDGSGEPWEYMDGWAYRVDGTGPDAAAFSLGNWTFSGINANDDDTTQAGATNPWPIGTYSDMASEDPSLTISAPTTDQVFAAGTTSVDVIFSTMNFDLTGDNVVEYTVNGGAAETTQTSPITVNTVDGMSYTVALELKDATGSLTPPVTATATFSIGETVTVATIAELRALADGTEALLTGEAVLTFQATEFNRKWLEDDTAGIVVFDSQGVVTSTYNVGDGITGIEVIVDSFNNLKQIIPTSDFGTASSSNNDVIPQIVTVAQLDTNGEDFESEIVTIENGEITGPSIEWEEDENYALTTVDGDFNIRTSLNATDADYIGEIIPTGTVNLSGFIGQFGESYQITPRDLMDIESTSNCPLSLGAIETTCDSETDGQDSTTTTIAYTGGGTENYVITVTGGGTIAGDDPASVAEGTILIENVSEATTITVDITSTSCAISQEITTPACNAPLVAANLGELRAGTIGETYTLTGEAVLTFQKSERNQKWIEDDTAGILIDDFNGIITTTYNQGDGLTGITGTLGEFNNLLQFVPISDPGEATSTGNDITPQIVTIAELNANGESFESEIVLIEDSTISGDSTEWIDDQNYTVTTSDGTFTLRTSLEPEDTDYIGTTIPVEAVNLAGFIGQFGDTYQITPRDLNDIDFVLSVDENTIQGLSIYPNPTSTFVFIEGTSTAQKEVEIFDITGKKVINTTINTTLDVSNLAPGLYVLQITQDNAQAVSKLIIK